MSKSRTTEFASFVREAPASRKKEVFKKVILQSSEDQKRIIEEANKISSRSA